jgi:phage I-like protein
MTTPTQPKPADIKATVALTFEITANADGTVPTEAHLLPSGYFRATDGRPYCCAAWFIDAAVAAQVIARMAAKKNDTMFDFEHQSLYADDNDGLPTPAAGWFHALEWRETGLYAINIDWVEDTKPLILSKKIRYISAVFSYYEGTGEVLEILSVALTNSPALDGLDALAALSKRFSSLTTDKGTTMPDPQVAVLTAERDTLKTQAVALTAERDELKTANTALTAKVAELEQEKVATAVASEQQQCADLLQAALTTGKVRPSAKAYLSTIIDIARLKEAIDCFGDTKDALLTKQHTKDATTGNHGLTETEIAMCTKMGVTPENYLKTKEA